MLLMTGPKERGRDKATEQANPFPPAGFDHPVPALAVVGAGRPAGDCERESCSGMSLPLDVNLGGSRRTRRALAWAQTTLDESPPAPMSRSAFSMTSTGARSS